MSDAFLNQSDFSNLDEMRGRFIDLVSEHPVLTGEGETLHDSSSEILESFGGEPAMKSLIAAV